MLNKLRVVVGITLLLAILIMSACSNNNQQHSLVGSWENVSTTNLLIPPGSAFTSLLVYNDDGTGRRETVLQGQTIHSEFDWHIEGENVLVKTNRVPAGVVATAPQSIEVVFRDGYVIFYYDSSLAIDTSQPVFATFRRR